MEMCPYCGEEGPEEAAKCWKCGAVLVDEDEAGDLLDAPPDAPTLVPCPNCEAPQPPKAHRCRECGRVINELEEVASNTGWKLGGTLAFAGMGLLVFLILGIVIATNKGEEKRSYLPTPYITFHKRYNARVLSQKSRDKWAKEYHHKFVKWRGKVIAIDGAVVELAMSKKGRKANKAEVRVSFLSSQKDLVSKLAKGKSVDYDARLVGYNEDGFRIVLDRAKLRVADN